jgi:hypothetical protein
LFSPVKSTGRARNEKKSKSPSLRKGDGLFDYNRKNEMIDSDVFTRRGKEVLSLEDAI